MILIKDIGKAFKSKMMNLTEVEAGLFLISAIVLNLIAIGLLLLV